MIRLHVAAVLALVDAVPNVNVYDAIVPNDPALPYVVVRTDTGPRTRSSILATSDRLDLTVWCTSVGATREQAQWVAEKVAGALLDVRPTVSGRQCFPIESVNSQPAQRDDAISPPLMYAVDEYRLTSIP